jgi:hypothetical protein
MTVRRMRNTVMSRDTTTYGKIVSGSVVWSAPQEDPKTNGLGLDFWIKTLHQTKDPQLSGQGKNAKVVFLFISLKTKVQNLPYIFRTRVLEDTISQNM